MNINIPDEYKVNSKIPIKEFIPKFLKPEQKRRIRNSIRSVIITHQIAGQKIPSFVDENNRCKVNKLSFYNEMFVKAYVVHNDTAYQKAFELLNTKLWYDADKTVALYSAYKDLVSQKYMLSKSTTQAEKLPYNIKIKKNIEILNQFLEEK